MMKVLKYFRSVVVIAFLLMVLSGCFYANPVFGFKYKDKTPFSATDRLNAGSEYPQELMTRFEQYMNSPKYWIDMTIFVTKPYQHLHIMNMTYSWDGGNGTIISDTRYELPKEIIDLNDPRQGRLYVTNGNYYWARIAGLIAKDLPPLNFNRIFKGKKPGDIFPFTVTITYQFDDKEIRTQVLEYMVHAYKGRYAPLFIGL